MKDPIFTLTDLADRLAKLPIGTEDAEAILDFSRRLENQYKWQVKRVNTAATMLGHSIIEETLMDEDDVR